MIPRCVFSPLSNDLSTQYANSQPAEDQVDNLYKIRKSFHSTLSSISASAPISKEFKNSILKQPPQSTPSTPLPVFNPYKNSISKLQSPPKVPTEFLPASDQFKNLIPYINSLPSSPINLPKNPKVKDQKTAQLSLKPPPKLLPGPDLLKNSTFHIKPLLSSTNPL